MIDLDAWERGQKRANKAHADMAMYRMSNKFGWGWCGLVAEYVKTIELLFQAGARP